MNFADSDEMFRHFKARGFEKTEDPKEAQAVLVNTCTVRDLAEHKAASYIGRLKSWKKNNPEGLIVVTGCAAERSKDEFRRKFPHIDLIVGAKDIEKFPKELEEILSQRVLDEEALVPSALQPPASLGPQHIVQHVTTMRGCNYNCAYCIVPSVRGREKYRSISDILQEVGDRVAEGTKEVWLLGQTVNSYKPPEAPKPDYDFADLLREVDRIPGLNRLRFISPHPFYFKEKLITAIAECSTVCEHMHLPVQSGSTSLLSKMRRNYTRDSYLKIVDNLRKAVPQIAITTDFIVGFPGETDEDFKLTLSLVKEAQLDSAYCFKYSPRPGTESAQWEDDIPTAVKEDRLAVLLETLESQSQIKTDALIGTTQEVLIEESKGNNLFRGKTRGAWHVRIEDPQLKLGDIVQAKITHRHSRELKGEVQNAECRIENAEFGIKPIESPN